MLSFYPELLQEGKVSDLVLTRVEVVNPSLTVADAERVFQLLVRFYTDPTEFALVQKLNLSPQDFKWDALVEKLKPDPLTP